MMLQKKKSKNNHPYGILIIGGSGCGKTSALLNLMIHKICFDKIYFYPKDPYEAKYQFLINKCEGVGLKEYSGSKSFIEHLNDTDDIYKNSAEYKPGKEHQILIVFDDVYDC